MLTREQLSALDKAALIEIVLVQSARIAEQETRIAQLEARVLNLEARLNQNSNNSSKPPSSDPPFPKIAPKPNSGKKSGGQPGHKGHGLSRVGAPDHVQVHRPENCAHCGYLLEDVPAEIAGSWQVFDLPADLRIEVSEHQRQSRCCPWCEKQSQGTLPVWLSQTTPCQWGPRCRALGVYLVQQQHLPYERTRALFVDLFGAAPSEGTLYHWQEQAYETLAPVEAKIAEALVESGQIGADETPARGAGWLHCLVCVDWTWYGVHQKRGREAMESFGLLTRYPGLLMSDCLASYTIYGGERSLCCAHLLRELAAVAEQGHLWAERMTTLLLSLKERVEASGAPLARSALVGVYGWFGRTLALGWRENESAPREKSARLLSRLEACRDAYLRFVTTPGAWFDNNISERALRMMKLHVKISGCFRSSLGCQILCRVRGYLSTMHKQGQNLFAALRSVMEGTPALPPLLQPAN
jgi:transposase